MPPAPAPSNFDGNQVLQHAFEESTGRLRVDASLSPGGGQTEVIIDHTEDSIRLGDGTNFLTSTTNGPKVGLDVNLINASPITVEFAGPSSPIITNISVPTANTEQSFVIPATAKSALLRLRSTNRLQFTFTSGTSGTNYITVPRGCSYEFDRLDLNSSITVYFQSSGSGDTLEVLYWN